MEKHDLDVWQIVLFFLAGICFIPVTSFVLAWFSFSVTPLYPLAVAIGVGVIMLWRGQSRQIRCDAFCFLFGSALSYALLLWLFLGPLSDSPWSA